MGRRTRSSRNVGPFATNQPQPNVTFRLNRSALILNQLSYLTTRNRRHETSCTTTPTIGGTLCRATTARSRCHAWR